jgi:hypothetical protein
MLRSMLSKKAAAGESAKPISGESVDPGPGARGKAAAGKSEKVDVETGKPPAGGVQMFSPLASPYAAAANQGWD